MTEERLIEEFGCGVLDDAILQRWEKVTVVRPHKFMRRGLFFAHRELTQILDAKEQGKTIYLYTGRGPSSDTPSSWSSRSIHFQQVGASRCP